MHTHAHTRAHAHTHTKNIITAVYNNAISTRWSLVQNNLYSLIKLKSAGAFGVYGNSRRWPSPPEWEYEANSPSCWREERLRRRTERTGERSGGITRCTSSPCLHAPSSRAPLRGGMEQVLRDWGDTLSWTGSGPELCVSSVSCPTCSTDWWGWV